LYFKDPVFRNVVVVVNLGLIKGDSGVEEWVGSLLVRMDYTRTTNITLISQNSFVFLFEEVLNFGVLPNC